MCKDLNSQKGRFSSPSKVEIQANPDFVKKIVYKVSDSVLVVFTKCENTGIESFFVSLNAN